MPKKFLLILCALFFALAHQASADSELNERRANEWASQMEGSRGGRIANPRVDTEENSRALLDRARSKINAGDYDGALSDAASAAALSPQSGEARSLQAVALNYLKRFAEAEKAAVQCLRLDPRNADGYESLAFAQLRLKRYADAEQSASRALNFSRDSGRAYYIRAAANEGLGLITERMNDMEKAAELDALRYMDHLSVLRDGGTLLEDEGSAEIPEWALAVGVGAVILIPFVLWGMSRKGEKPADSGEESEIVVKKRSALSPGHMVGGKYKLVHIIGRGGMGQVWEGLDTSLNRVVALKEFSSEIVEQSPEMREFFVREAKMVASIRHRNVADIYEIVDNEEGLFMVLEMVKGKTVAHILAERKTLPLAEIREILLPVCSALEYAHGLGVIHRDLKPANIMMTEQGFVKLLDFGIARRLTDAPAAAGPPGPGASAAAAPLMGRTRSIAGTPGYMPPEAEEGIVSPATDVYALGVCFYEMLTGMIPPSPFPGGVSEKVDALMVRAVDPGRETRLGSVREFAGILEAL